MSIGHEWEINGQNALQRPIWSAVAYSAIHKTASLMSPGRSMILPGTIPETPISHEWEPPAGMGL